MRSTAGALGIRMANSMVMAHSATTMKVSPSDINFMRSRFPQCQGVFDHPLDRVRSARYVFNIEAATADRDVYEADRMWVRNFSPARDGFRRLRKFHGRS